MIGWYVALHRGTISRHRCQGKMLWIRGAQVEDSQVDGVDDTWPPRSAAMLLVAM